MTKSSRLYNGIVLPEEWPPRDREPLSEDPMPVPYLDHPPSVLPVDVGRQLFVDDFLIESTTLDRVFHKARKHAGNPVFRAESPEEVAGRGTVYLGHGGLFFDPEAGRFHLFYVAGWRGTLNLATSANLADWERPVLRPGRGNVLIDRTVDDHALWLDPCAPAHARLRYLECHRRHPYPPGVTERGHYLYTSQGGRDWTRVAFAGVAGDYCSFFHNPFRNVWVSSIKPSDTGRRIRRYQESAFFDRHIDWSGAVHWTGADRRDAPEPEEAYPGAGDPCQLYSLNAVAYESLMVGLHYIHRGPDNRICRDGGFPKLTDLELGFSRDGFHWDRPDRTGFIRGERLEGAWDRAYLHGTTGVFVLLGDRLVFPYTGFSGFAPDGSRGMYHGGAIGLATLRRDGFASMDADGSGGELVTRPVVFGGAHLFVNVDNPAGSLRVEVLDENGLVVPGFSRADGIPVSADATCAPVRWKGAESLAPLAGRPVRFRFLLTRGRLYSFWVSRSQAGPSGGYVGAGGPEYAGVRDEATGGTS